MNIRKADMLPALLLKTCCFPHDPKLPETIWREQPADVQGEWRDRARSFVDDLTARGHTITQAVPNREDRPLTDETVTPMRRRGEQP